MLSFLFYLLSNFSLWLPSKCIGLTTHFCTTHFTHSYHLLFLYLSFVRYLYPSHHLFSHISSLHARSVVLMYFLDNNIFCFYNMVTISHVLLHVYTFYSHTLCVMTIHSTRFEPYWIFEIKSNRLDKFLVNPNCLIQ